MLAEWPSHLTSDVMDHIIQVTVHNKAQDLVEYTRKRYEYSKKRRSQSVKRRSNTKSDK